MARKSNIELLRIVAMLFIIAHHLLVHGKHIWEHTTWDNFALLSLDSAFFVGVNVFVLISGYFEIKFTWRKLINIWLLCAATGGLCYFTHLYIDGQHIGQSMLYNTIFYLSNPQGTWFIQCYVFLFLIAPLINSGLRQMNKRQHLSAVLAWAVISVYFGWWWHNDVNRDGYNLVNFIWLYCVGRYLNLYYDTKNVKRGVFLIIWVICSMLNVFLGIIYPQRNIWAYNNPIIVISAISLLLFFLSFDLNSKWINTISASTLGVYLIHENSYVSPHIYSGQFHNVYSQSIIGFISSVLIVYASCVLIDMALRFLITKLVTILHKLLPNSERN